MCTWGVSGGMAACVCDAKLDCVSAPPPQPVRLDTGAPIASTRVTVTTEPSAAPMMGSAGAAPAGLDSTAHSVSLTHPPTPTPSLLSRRTVSSAGRLVELQQKVGENLFLFFFFFFFRPKDRFGLCQFLFEVFLFFFLFEFCQSKEHF